MGTKMAAVAASVMVAAGTMVATPAGAVDDIPNREMWADRYLSAVCPSNAANDRASRQWDLAFDGRRIAPLGAPTTRGLRRAFRHQAKALSRGGQMFARWDWPDQIAPAAARMARGAYHDAIVAQRRSETRKVTRYWGGDWAKVGGAATTMRLALHLPPPVSGSDGC